MCGSSKFGLKNCVKWGIHFLRVQVQIRVQKIPFWSEMWCRFIKVDPHKKVFGIYPPTHSCIQAWKQSKLILNLNIISAVTSIGQTKLIKTAFRNNPTKFTFKSRAGVTGNSFIRDYQYKLPLHQSWLIFMYSFFESEKVWTKKETKWSLEQLALGQWRSLYLGGVLRDSQSNSVNNIVTQ